MRQTLTLLATIIVATGCVKAERSKIDWLLVLCVLVALEALRHYAMHKWRLMLSVRAENARIRAERQTRASDTVIDYHTGKRVIYRRGASI